MSEPIMWGGDDPFTHLLAVGPTRCGKSATVLSPMAYQLLLQKKRGKKVGFSLIEPKGDLVQDIKEYCDEMEVPYIYIDPESPDSHRFNVMEGDKDDVAEATVAVLQSLFGKQEAFFQTVQELSTRNVTKLLKELKGDDCDLMDLLETLRDEKLLGKRVQELKMKNPNSELIPFFENELLGSLKDQYRKLVIGLRSQLENITSNQKLRRIITGKSDIDLDKHLEEGGILLVNTSLGKLKSSGDAFGKFVIMHLQSATFRREGTEKTRTPHFLIADEYSRYINPDVEMFLSIAASYRVAGVFATQSLGQLEVETGKISGKAMKQAILTSCRNKIAFCGLSSEDAKEFAEEFGKDRVVMRQSTYKNRILLPRFFPDHYRDTEIEEYRYHYTYLQDSMKRFHFLCRILKNGTPQKPFEGIGQFVPRDWKDRREWDMKKIDENKIMQFITNGKRLIRQSKGLQQKVTSFVTSKKAKEQPQQETEEEQLINDQETKEDLNIEKQQIEAISSNHELEYTPDENSKNQEVMLSDLEIEPTDIDNETNLNEIKSNDGEEIKRVPNEVRVEEEINLENVYEPEMDHGGVAVKTKPSQTKKDNEELIKNKYNEDDFM
ncbi:type IV secretory system conjugative DNA transfer family protein [Gracilibacillus thailandensis]|uniref:TraM recognition domain-containing protein n=1 Tax=Gracilibacillus thailandensis TaxID=563735 RepID=A0A6N7QVN7_9BACI|nr:TraM recognition domain-containing protein [Gracilibacillus thailandensis]MRI66173.1 TraM recognition domain-containing protein [Gracilibacillus thailandensis]